MSRPIYILGTGGLAREMAQLLEQIDRATGRWSFEGYAPAEIDAAAAMLLTPPSTVRAFQAGYLPILHPGANA